MDQNLYEVDLRPGNVKRTAPDGVHIRTHSTSTFHDFLNSAFRKTFSWNKRRLTTSDLVKNSISLPTNCSRVSVTEEPLNISVAPIQSCPFDITGYGKFLLMDEFKVQKPKKMAIMVFLYEKILIFTRKIDNEESYYYMGNLKLNHIALMPSSKNVKLLELKDHVASKRFHKEIVVTLEAPTEYIQVHWRKTVEKCLWGQLFKAKRDAGLGKH
ncbi:uncharacterized protein [Euwallacea fornicatus]|uniref:uncharacterized protein n=1 Tax=Euwallacea fornicatus TaxID=995702 RepID=UPI00338F2C33